MTAPLPDQTVPQWHWTSQPLAGRCGAEVFSVLFLHQPTAVLLESPWIEAGPVNSRFSICAGAPRWVEGQMRQWTPAVGSILSCLRNRLAESQSDIRRQRQSYECTDHLPFTGGWLGWLGYDTAWEIEALPQHRQDDLPFPVAFWYEPENFAVLDHQDQVLWLAATDPQQLEVLEQQLSARACPNADEQRSNGCGSLKADDSACGAPTMLIDQSAFEAMVRTAKAHIQAGDIFQANLSVRFHASGAVQPWHLYQTLQRINPSPFASYWQTPWGCIVSCSPERLVQLRDRLAQTRPIAGTRPRGATPADEQAFRQELGSSPKERAEHTMLVDLGRNDLGRVCIWGTVRVDEFFEVETYSHVMHLVSNVVGELQPGADAVDLIRALFPGGTITGCPKVRCMELIEALEPVRRSLFYGSCGFLDRRGFLDLNILIRTLLVTAASSQSGLWNQSQPVHIWGQVGAGIVADSDPTLEWFESLQKAKAQWAALQQMGIYPDAPRAPVESVEHGLP